MSAQPRWVWILSDCANADPIMPGAALLALSQRGVWRQALYLMRKKFARTLGGRLVATKTGRRELAKRVTHWRTN